MLHISYVSSENEAAFDLYLS